MIGVRWMTWFTFKIVAHVHDEVRWEARPGMPFKHPHGVMLVNGVNRNATVR